MKAGGLQRTNYYFTACHVTAKVHIISWRAASSFCSSFREFILVLRAILKSSLTKILCEVMPGVNCSVLGCAIV